ncbi:hypothetical protein [Streptomyces sp. NPDC057052]|uniref:hypothetical protein n=1 Tax=Streptomyces sp. NPDC057052 TaxID=3346010 RepID=UPI00363BD7AC
MSLIEQAPTAGRSVVFSTSGAPIDPGTADAAATPAGGLADVGVSHAVIAPTSMLRVR